MVEFNFSSEFLVVGSASFNCAGQGSGCLFSESDFDEIIDKGGQIVTTIDGEVWSTGTCDLPKELAVSLYLPNISSFMQRLLVRMY